MLCLQQAALGCFAALPPHGFVPGLQDLPPALGFLGGAWLHANNTAGSFHKWQSVINALLLTTVMMRSLERPGKEWAWGPKPPLISLKCCTCFTDKEQLLLPELSVKASFLSAKVTVNNRITLKNINGSTVVYVIHQLFQAVNSLPPGSPQICMAPSHHTYVICAHIYMFWYVQYFALV